jgi:hypothetical protein
MCVLLIPFVIFDSVLLIPVKTKLNRGFTAIDNEHPKKIFLRFITMGVFVILSISLFGCCGRQDTG